MASTMRPTRKITTRIASTVPTMPRIMPVRAWLSPPSRPWDARISLSALWPNAHANGETSHGHAAEEERPISPTRPSTSDNVAWGWSGGGATKPP